MLGIHLKFKRRLVSKAYELNSEFPEMARVWKNDPMCWRFFGLLKKATQGKATVYRIFKSADMTGFLPSSGTNGLNKSESYLQIFRRNRLGMLPHRKWLLYKAWNRLLNLYFREAASGPGAIFVRIVQNQVWLCCVSLCVVWCWLLGWLLVCGLGFCFSTFYPERLGLTF